MQNTFLMSSLCVFGVIGMYILDDFQGFCIHGSSKGTPRTVKMNMHFSQIASVFDTEKSGSRQRFVDYMQNDGKFIFEVGAYFLVIFAWHVFERALRGQMGVACYRTLNRRWRFVRALRASNSSAQCTGTNSFPGSGYASSAPATSCCVMAWAKTTTFVGPFNEPSTCRLTCGALAWR